MGIRAGISDIVFSIPRLYLPLANRDNPNEPTEFSLSRETDPGKYLYGIGVANMSVPDTYQDPVTLAANSIYELIERNDIRPKDINRIEIGTETSPDKSKSIGTYVIGALEQKLGKGSLRRCASPEGKSACAYTAFSLENALDWIRSGRSNGKSRIIVATDIAKYALKDGGEPTQGAAAVAVLVEREPDLMEFDDVIGQCTIDEDSFYRPDFSDVAFVNGKKSEIMYLTAMKEAFDHYKEEALELGLMNLNSSEALTDKFDLISFHQPFPKMVQRAYAGLLVHEYRNLPRWKNIVEEIGEEPRREDFESEIEYQKEDKNFVKRFEKTDLFRKSFKEKVADGQLFGMESGNSYTVSAWGHNASMLLLKDKRGEDLAGKRGAIGFFGSGCNASGQSYVIVDDYKDVLKRSRLMEKLDNRIDLTLEEYEDLHDPPGKVKKWFRKLIRSSKLHGKKNYILEPENEFVLTGIENGYRSYKFV